MDNEVALAHKDHYDERQGDGPTGAPAPYFEGDQVASTADGATRHRDGLLGTARLVAVCRSGWSAARAGKEAEFRVGFARRGPVRELAVALQQSIVRVSAAQEAP